VFGVINRTFKKPNSVKLFRPIKQNAIGLVSIASHINDECATNILLVLRTIPALDCQIRAIIIRIVSSGGSLGAAQSIVEGIDLLREELGIPVVIIISEMATSAAFYIALSATTLVATEGATLGNMGAILRSVNPENFLEKIGIKYNAISSGSHKDSLSNFSSLKEEQTILLTGLVQELSEQFHSHLRTRRPQCSNSVELMAGQIFSGASALQYNLVDKLGGFFTAIQECERLTGLAGLKIRALDSYIDKRSPLTLAGLAELIRG